MKSYAFDPQIEGNSEGHVSIVRVFEHDDQHLVHYPPAGSISFQAGSNTDTYVEFRTLGRSWESCGGSPEQQMSSRGEEMSARWLCRCFQVEFSLTFTKKSLRVESQLPEGHLAAQRLGVGELKRLSGVLS